MHRTAMNLYLKYGDLNAVYINIKHHWEMGCDALIAKKDVYLIDGRLEFVMGCVDHSHNQFSHQVGACNIFFLRTLYEMMVLVKNHMIEAKDFIWGEVTDIPTLNIGAMVERQDRLRKEQQLEEKRQNSKRVKETVAALLISLRKSHFPLEGMEKYLTRNVGEGNEYFSYQAYLSFKGKRVCYNLFFERWRGSYRFDRFDATLLCPTRIEHGVYNGIDTRELEERILEMDWNCAEAETDDVVITGQMEFLFLYDTLSLLSKEAAGALIAAQLWNNHFPVLLNDKNGFIREAEKNATAMYPAMTFLSDMPLEEAFDALVCYQHLRKSTRLELYNKNRLLSRVTG